MYMDIVQFAKPEYINYVVVDRAAPEYDENSCKIRMAGRACQELYLGSSPYIALPDNYYIIDWKWGSFIYPPTNFLINCQWTDVKDRLQIWEYPSLFITSDFLKAYGAIGYDVIDKALHIAPPQEVDTLAHKGVPLDYLKPRFYANCHSLDDIPADRMDEYLADVKRHDSLQNVYMERLARIIEEGSLEKAADFLHKY